MVVEGADVMWAQGAKYELPAQWLLRVRRFDVMWRLVWGMVTFNYALDKDYCLLCY